MWRGLSTDGRPILPLNFQAHFRLDFHFLKIVHILLNKIGLKRGILGGWRTSQARTFQPQASNPKPFNHRLCNHELFNPGLSKHEFLNHGVEKSGVEKSGVEKSGVEAWGWKVRCWSLLGGLFVMINVINLLHIVVLIWCCVFKWFFLRKNADTEYWNFSIF